MSAKPGGGPAFPTERPIPGYSKTGIRGGMSLRDYFAGQALTGFATMPGFNHDNGQHAAKICYELADAMLAAREK